MTLMVQKSNLSMEELELTFLAKEVPAGVWNAAAREIVDMYIPVSAVHPTLRIRRAGERCEMTKKQPLRAGDASHQLETTVPLTAEEYAAFEYLNAKRVAKTRYYYLYGGVTYEFDVFCDALAGLVLIDVEFDTLEEKKNFVAPDFCLAEVTQEGFTAGGMLAGKSYEDITSDLARFGYKKLLRVRHD